MIRLTRHRPADASRRKIVNRAPHAVRDTPRHEMLVGLHVARLGGVAVHAEATRSRVGVGSGHEEALAREARFRLHEPRGLIIHLPRSAERIANDNGDSLLAVVEHEAPRVQLIVDVGGGKGIKPAHDDGADLRRDIACRCPRQQPPRLGVGRVRRQPDNEKNRRKKKFHNKFRQKTRQSHLQNRPVTPALTSVPVIDVLFKRDRSYIYRRSGSLKTFDTSQKRFTLGRSCHPRPTLTDLRG